jgi:hypothetical protein
MFATSFVLGYHGCDRRIGEGILRNDEHVAISKNRYDWLGEGAYLWENSPERAREWAEFLKKHPPQPSRRVAEPFVIGAIIELGNCLDLTDASSLQIIRAGYDEFQRTNALAGANVISIALLLISCTSCGNESVSIRLIRCEACSPKAANFIRARRSWRKLMCRCASAIQRKASKVIFGR